MKQILFTLGFLLLFSSCFSQQQKKEFTIHTIAFYNLENLYDTINDPNTKDEYSPILQMKYGRSEAYFKKIDNMAMVLSEIGKDKTKTSPTIIGICEIENSTVIKDLLNTKYFKSQSYDYFHVDSHDWRGIDVALLYKTTVFSPSNFKSFELKAYNKEGYKIKTRNQLLVSGYMDDELIHFIVNHWPSQLGGKQKTDYLREKSAELSKQIIDELRIEYKSPKIILMGDFNDNPTTDYFKEILLTTSKKEKTNKLNFYNPFESIFLNGHGTLGFRDNLNLFDQIMVSRSFTTKDYNNYQIYNSGIYNPQSLTIKTGKYKGYPFRSFTNGNFSGGYSDHYPVYIYLIKER